jgi:alpha-amylase
MPDICLYFQAHQPLRLRPYSLFEVGAHAPYFDLPGNAKQLNELADTVYLPANQLFARLHARWPGRFRFSLHLSGLLLRQLSVVRPDVVASFRELVENEGVELVGGTEGHTLAFLYDREEFEAQVMAHRELMRQEMGQVPRFLVQPGLHYTNPLGYKARQMGFEGLIVEGAPQVLGHRSPNHLYHPVHMPDFPLLLRNALRSDDVGLRFSDQHWPEYPLTPDKFATWMQYEPGEVVGICLPYETLGAYQPAETGIFEFFDIWVDYLLGHSDTNFLAASEAAARYEPQGSFDVMHHISWTDAERDLSGWQGTPLQQEAMEKLLALGPAVQAAGRADWQEEWQHLQQADFFYYMSEKTTAGPDRRAQQRQSASPYDAYLRFMNVIADFQLKLGRK